MSSDGEQTLRRFDWDVTPPSVAVVQTLSEATNRDESDLPQLVAVIDPDALDDIFDGPEPPLKVKLEYAGHTVVVFPDGRVSATPV